MGANKKEANPIANWQPMIPESVNRSLRIKVTLAIVLPLMVILGAFTIIEYNRHREVVLSNLSVLAGQSGRVVESNLRHAMLESDFAEVQTVLDTLGESDEFDVVYLLNPSGEVIFAPEQQGVGTQLTNSHPDCQPCHSMAVAERPQSIVITPAGREERVFRSMQPIVNREECAACHDSDERILGLLLTDISMEPMEAALAADLRENVVWSAITIVTVVLIVNIILNRFVLNRLEKFATAIAGLGRGSIPAPIHDDQPDEIGRLASAFNLMASQVRAREEENKLLSEHLRRQSAQRGELYKRVITAQEDERRRVARELHDGLGQALSGLGYQAEAVERLIRDDPGRARQQIHLIRSLVATTTQEMYELIFDLRPSVLDDMGLVAALRAYAQRLFGDRDINFELRSDGLQQRMPAVIETSLYRIYQEALTNVVRHAHASRVRIELGLQQDVFVGKVVDNGIGFDMETTNATGLDERGLGLLGMQERIAGCSGTIDIQSRPECGTRILIRVPLKGQSCD